MIDWPSDRVKPGGVFHLKETRYSKATENLLRVLMEESKLTMLQRQHIQNNLRQGSSLPMHREDMMSSSKLNTNHCFTAGFRKKDDARRRSLEVIKSSGAYEQPGAMSGVYREPIHLAKKRLQEKMSGMKGTPRTTRMKKSVASATRTDDTTETPQDGIDKLLDEISERTMWLEEMEKLGEGKKYRGLIQNQITEKLREIRRLEQQQHEADSKGHLEEQLNQLSFK